MSNTARFTGRPPTPDILVNGEPLLPGFGIHQQNDNGLWLAWIVRLYGGPGNEERVHDLDTSDDVRINGCSVQIDWPEALDHHPYPKRAR